MSAKKRNTDEDIRPECHRWITSLEERQQEIQKNLEKRQKDLQDGQIKVADMLGDVMQTLAGMQARQETEVKYSGIFRQIGLKLGFIVVGGFVGTALTAYWSISTATDQVIIGMQPFLKALLEVIGK